MHGDHNASAAQADPRSSRTSPLGTRFNTATLLDFIRSGLRHSAVSDEVTQLLYDHVSSGRIALPPVSQRLRPILDEALATANNGDFLIIARELVAGAEDALGGGRRDADAARRR